MTKFWNFVEHLSINGTDFIIMELPVLFKEKLFKTNYSSFCYS